MTMLLAAVGILAVSGLAAMATSRTLRLSTALGVGGAVLGSLLGLVPALATLAGHAPAPVTGRWLHELGGSFSVALDPLAAFFVVVILVVTGLAAVYGGAYVQSFAGRYSVGAALCFFNLLSASMVMVALARNGVLFLVAWEMMAFTSFFLVVFEDDKDSVRRAGWVYVVATHLGMGFLITLFVLLCQGGNSLDFSEIVTDGVRPVYMKNLLFCLAVVGFGIKAGFVPMHVWLPEAHAAAPSHVSAVLSAVMVKMGIYGILRTLTFLGAPEPWWGPFLLILGLAGALFGIAMAMIQRDLKRALAYSTVENVGLILLALGTALWGLANDLPLMAALGIAAAFLHILNHAFMKGTLFLAAGSILHGAGTRDLEKLGGLLKRMPWTGTAMIVAAVAISGLPPLNGFVSEWLMYIGLLRGGIKYFAPPDALAALLAVGFLALVGGLAAICFVRLAGIVLLGNPRSAAAGHAHESPAAMTIPMTLLACLCIGVALVPSFVIAGLAPAMDQIFGQGPGQTMTWLHDPVNGVSLLSIGLMNLAIWAAIAVATWGLWSLYRRYGAVASGTWGCGYVMPTPRIQYTNRSFTETMADHLLPGPLRPHTAATTPQGLFPAPGSFGSSCPDPMSDKVYQPFFRKWADRFARLRWLQQGKLPIYLLYLLILVVLGFAWVSLRSWGGFS
jgi:hydrogenase-4 component B